MKMIWGVVWREYKLSLTPPEAGTLTAIGNKG